MDKNNVVGRRGYRFAAALFEQIVDNSVSSGVSGADLPFEHLKVHLVTSSHVM